MLETGEAIFGNLVNTFRIDLENIIREYFHGHIRNKHLKIR